MAGKVTTHALDTALGGGALAQFRWKALSGRWRKSIGAQILGS